MATSLMTLFMKICAVISHRNMYPVSILRQMLAMLIQKETNAGPMLVGFTAGTTHYAIGILFTLVYYLLRSSEDYIGFYSSAEPWIMGIIYGMVGVWGWIIFIRLHLFCRFYLYPGHCICVAFFVEHLLFAFVMVYAVGWLVK